MKKLSLLLVILFAGCNCGIVNQESYTLSDATSGLEIVESRVEAEGTDTKNIYELDKEQYFGIEIKVVVMMSSDTMKSVSLEYWTHQTSSYAYRFADTYFNTRFDRSFDRQAFEENRMSNYELVNIGNGFWVGRNKDGNLEVRLNL